MTINYETADFYADLALIDDPHAYFDYLRAKGPVVRLPHRNVVAVTVAPNIPSTAVNNFAATSASGSP